MDEKMTGDWRAMLDELSARMRELDGARAEIVALRASLASAREQARVAEEAWAMYDARARAGRRVETVNPKRLGDVEIAFGQTRDDTVPVPQGPGNAQFVYGLLEALLSDDRPLYFCVERRPKGVLRAAEDEAKDAA